MLKNPFKGLKSYEQKDKGELFGRDKDLILIKDRIFAAGTTLLFAGSGVGKTSFLNAKIIPELSGQYRTCYHNRWAESRPLEGLKKSLVEQLGMDADASLSLTELLSRFSKRPKEEDGKNDSVTSDAGGKDAAPFDFEALLEADKSPPRCLLILDQFEEIFQYHAYQEYFRTFLDELCAVVNSTDLQVRVIFSMREEFLGELSIFDNRIPDLFNNYYRLKYPDKTEAENIVELTCELVKAKVDEKKLPLLIRDLSKIEKGVDGATGVDAKEGNSKHFIERDFIVPPYLQIACQKLWNEQAKATNGDGAAQSFKFLSDYKDDQAQEMLRQFCYEKLNALTKREKHLAAEAFNFLVTKQGAKMAYELSRLAQHMKVSKEVLRETLDKLSDESTRILRSSKSPDGSHWYELYHDMYGPIVDRWTKDYRRQRAVYNYRLMGSIAAVAVLATLLFIALYRYVYIPRQYEETLNDAFIALRSGQEMESDHYYANLIYKRLSEIYGSRSKGRALWAAHWAEHARQAARDERRDEALIYTLQALAVDPYGPHADALRREAGRLRGEDYGGVMATLRGAGPKSGAHFSPDGKLVLTQNNEGSLRVWPLDDGRADGGGEVLVLNPSSVEQPAPSASKQGGTRAGNAARATAQSANNRMRAQGPGGAPSSNQGFRATLIPAALAVARLAGGGPVFAGVFNTNEDDAKEFRHKLYVWRAADGKLLDSRGIDNEWDDSNEIAAGISNTDVAVAFSPDGRYLAAEGKEKKPRLWKLSEDKIEPVEAVKQAGYVTSVAFSPDGKFLLMGSGERKATLWNLSTYTAERTVVTPYAGERTADSDNVKRVVFSPDGKTFLTECGDNMAQLWETESGRTLGPPLAFDEMDIDLALAADGKTILNLRNEENFAQSQYAINMMNGESGVKTGTSVPLPLNTSILAFSPDSKSALLNSGDDDVQQVAAMQAREPQGKLFQSPEGFSFSFNKFSGDGKYLTTLIRRPKVAPPADKPKTGGDTDATPYEVLAQVWDTATRQPVGEPLANYYRLSLDGNFIFTREKDSPDMQMWEVAPTRRVVSLPRPDLRTYFYVSSGGRFVATSRLGFGLGSTKATLLNVANGQSQSFNTIGPAFGFMRFSPDEQYFVAATRESNIETNVYLLKVIKLSTGEDLSNRFKPEDNHPRGAQGGTFSRDNKLITVGRNKDETARIWNLATGEVRVLKHDATVTMAGFSPDGRLAVTGTEDGTVRLWDTAATEKPLGESTKHKSKISRIIVSDDGEQVIAVTDKWAHFYSIQTVVRGGKELHYERSRFIGAASSLSFDDTGTKLKIVSFVNPNTSSLKEIEFKDTDTGNPLSGSSVDLLNEWQKKLSLSLTPYSGEIKSNWTENEVAPQAGAEPPPSERGRRGGAETPS